MSPSTPPTASPAPPRTGPARFQTVEPTPTGSHLAASIGSALLLLVLVVGVPVGLLLLDGPPSVPTRLPTREDLMGTIGPEQVLAVLVWVVWIAWLQFTWCVVVELRSALRGVGLPGRVPLAGPSQRFARTLVASVILLATAAGPATALSAPTHLPEPAPASVSASATSEAVGEQGSAPGSAAGSALVSAPVEQAGSVEYRLGDIVLDPDEGAELVGKKVTVVSPPEGRYHDNLWDIAERELGDGRRYQEVFELNKGRDQPDGQELTLARLIQPGWLLVMPEDAAGAQRVVAVSTPAPLQEAPPVQEAPPAPDGGAADASGDVGSGTAAGAADDLVGGLSGSQLVGVGLLAAGVLALVEQVRRRRRTPEPSDDAVEAEVALRVGATPGRVDLLDRGLRQLADALRTAGRDLPGAYGAVVDDARLTLLLSPPDPDAPGAWTAERDGAAWTLAAGDLGRARGGPAPFPGLVSVGRDDAGADVLLDLEAAQGPVAVTGDLAVAREVATAVAAELATNRWSDGLRVTGLDLPEQLAALRPERYRSVADLGAVLPTLRDRRVDALGTSVLSGRLRGAGSAAWVPEYAVLGSPLAADGDATRALVEAASADQRSPLGVVAVGDVPGARWELVVDAEGGLEVPVLGVVVRANRLAARDVALLAELVAPEPGTEEPLDLERIVLEHEYTGERPPVDAPDRPLDLGSLEAAPVRVTILGAPRVHAPGVVDEDRRALVTELVVHLALHPAGVHPTVLAGALWPRGVTAAVRDATIDRAATWLGPGPDGRPVLERLADGRLRLGPGAVLDWDVVRSLLARSRGATPAQERADLAAVLRLAQGGVLAERPPGRYAWLARVRLERAARSLLVDAAHRLVVLCWNDDDPGAAREAAWSGLRVAPLEELLWRDLLRATMATGGPDAVRDVAADVEATLHASGVPSVSAPTAALLEELLPSGSGGGTTLPGSA